MFIAFKVGECALVNKPLCHFELARGTGLIALAIHRSIKARLIDFNVSFATNISGEIKRKTVRIVERENCIAIQHRCSGTARLDCRQRGKRNVKDFHAMLKGFTKTLFFLAQHLFNPSGCFCQLWIGLPHLFDQVFDEQIKERLGLA